MISSLTVYLSLFMASFLAATIIPAQSEAVLSALLLTGNYTPWLLVGVASFANTLGACINWGIGMQVERFKKRPWFPLSPSALARATKWYHRYGHWSLLLSWMPFIGDPLTLAAGIMRERFTTFLILVGIAKTCRYIAIALFIR